MKSHLRFLTGLLMGGLLGGGLFYSLIVLQWGAPTESSRWCYEIMQKKKAIAIGIARPKLLIAGGSSALFSINAEQIEAMTRIPTVNMGTHAALGPKYILDQIKQVAKPGDTVLLALEYELYAGGARRPYWDDELYIDYLMARDPRYLKNLPWRERSFLMFSTSFTRLKHGLKAKFFGERRRSETGVYDAALLDHRGDQTGIETAHKPVNAVKINRAHPLLIDGFSGEPKGFAIIADFYAWARNNRVHILATYPALAANPRYANADLRDAPKRVKEFYARLGVPLLENQNEVIYPHSDFFDTVYHLTAEGARRRTQHLILALDSVRLKWTAK